MGDRVADKIALVTGAAAGLGRAIALRLSEEGAALVLADINAAGLAETERQIKANGRPVMALAADVTEEAPVKALFGEIFKAHGRLDILVNDVGGGTSGRIWEAKVEDWDFVLRLNLRSAFLCTREAAAHMRERRYGRIINLSSVHGFAAGVNHAHYEATKGGITMFTKALAIELAPHRITVNAIAPGAIEVERYFKTMASYDPQRMGSRIPLGRVGYPEDVAPLAVLLASEQGSYITGETILVDGGLIARMAL